MEEVAKNGFETLIMDDPLNCTKCRQWNENIIEKHCNSLWKEVKTILNHPKAKPLNNRMELALALYLSTKHGAVY